MLLKKKILTEVFDKVERNYDREYDCEEYNIVEIDGYKVRLMHDMYRRICTRKYLEKVDFLNTSKVLKLTREQSMLLTKKRLVDDVVLIKYIDYDGTVII